MPDFERVTRSLELHVAATPEQKSYIQGKHDGLDLARKQVAAIVAIVAISAVAIATYIH